MIGVHYEDNHVATGFGNHLAKPILRDEWNEDLSYEEGVKLLEKCMRVLLYRDRSAVNKLQVKSFWGLSRKPVFKKKNNLEWNPNLPRCVPWTFYVKPVVYEFPGAYSFISWFYSLNCGSEALNLAVVFIPTSAKSESFSLLFFWCKQNWWGDIGESVDLIGNI